MSNDENNDFEVQIPKHAEAIQTVANLALT